MKLPTLGYPNWAHAGNDEDDLIKSDEYIEDKTFQIIDVCGTNLTSKCEIKFSTCLLEPSHAFYRYSRATRMPF